MDERSPTPPTDREVQAVRDHSRLWRGNRYVYPVVSRRARGVSIGINVNPSKACTFNCVYCQVNRGTAGDARPVDLGVLIRELNAMLDWVAGGEVWADPAFGELAEELRRVDDIAFSGDGEPTVHRNFADLVQVAADAKDRRRLRQVKLVVISNATRFHTRAFRLAVPILKAHQGQVWAKLDAGSSERFARVNRTTVPFRQVLENIEWLAREMPIVIQSCLVRLDGAAPDETELELYVERLRRVLERGGRLAQVQLYTIARAPAERNVSWLSEPELTAIAAVVRDALPEVNVEVFGGADAPPQEADGKA